MKRKNFLKTLLGLPLALKAADTLTDGDVKMREFRESGMIDRDSVLKDLLDIRPGHVIPISGLAMTCLENYPEFIDNPNLALKAGKYYGGAD